MKIVRQGLTVIGSIFSGYGIGNIVQAYKNDDPDTKSTGVQALTAGVLLIAIRGCIGVLNSAKDHLIKKES